MIICVWRICDKEELVLVTEEDRKMRTCREDQDEAVCEGYWKIQFSTKNSGEVECIE
ncbi:hypothetical protein E2C01_076326 [Portunus trituberculatus]|uniref:Uncharacterized protein n=1 Tax=Portunus trituberculatus TaxID=210409 RepID=A0A5B7IHJ7_PORTR|nr:hypothetical protein [Portunus trituberculatus]